MKKNHIILFLTAALFFAGCSAGKKDSGEVVRYVKTEKIREISKGMCRVFAGRIKENKKVNLSFRVSGPISKIHVEEGVKVNKGDVLAEMDSRDYQVQVNGLRARYLQVVSETDKLKKLYEKRRISENDFQKALAGRKAVTAKYTAAMNSLRDTKIRAPFAGYIQEKFYSDSELVKAGYPVLSIIKVDSLEIETEIPADFFLKREQFKNCYAYADINPEKKIDLKLRDIQKKSNQNQLYRATFLVNKNSGKMLAPGMGVSVYIEYSTDHAVTFLVPAHSIFHRNNESYVWLFKKDSGKVSPVKIDVLKVGADGAVVSGNLNSEMYVVSAGIYSVKENKKYKALKKTGPKNVGGLL